MLSNYIRVYTDIIRVKHQVKMGVYHLKNENHIKKSSQKGMKMYNFWGYGHVNDFILEGLITYDTGLSSIQQSKLIER